jgi:hypothetical protein
MIRPDKLEHALYALSGIVVETRAMAANGRSPEELAEVLDWVEYLPPFLAAPQDETDDFRAFLEGLATKYPQFAFALERFDAAQPPAAWWA